MTIKDNPIAKYFFESRDELSKVVWPTRDQVIQLSLLVIGISLAMAAYFGLTDLLLSKGLDSLLGLIR